MAWKRYSISIDPKVWDEVQELLRDEFNMSMSKYIELMLRQLRDSRTQSARQMFEGIAETLFSEMTKKGTKSVQKGEKKGIKKLPKK